MIRKDLFEQTNFSWIIQSKFALSLFFHNSTVNLKKNVFSRNMNLTIVLDDGCSGKLWWFISLVIIKYLIYIVLPR